MKFKINTKELTSLLNPLQSVINDNHIVPILQNVKIDISEKGINVTGDNHETNCENFLKLKTGLKDSFCVNFNMLLSIVRAVPNQDVDLRLEKNIFYIKHNKGEFELPVFSSNEFPETPEEDFTGKALVDGVILKSCLKIANKFTLNEALDPMSNISIQIGKKITIRATNRFSLFREVIKGKGDEKIILLSGKASTGLLSLIEDAEDIDMFYNDNRIYFKFGKKKIMIIQQQGNFPIDNFDGIINTSKGANELKVDVSEFNSALKRATTLSSKEKEHKISLNFRKNNLEFLCDNTMSGTKGQEVIKSDFPEEKSVSYNFKMLQEILSVFDNKPKLSINEKNCFCITSNKKTGILAPRG